MRVFRIYYKAPFARFHSETAHIRNLCATFRNALCEVQAVRLGVIPCFDSGQPWSPPK